MKRIFATISMLAATCSTLPLSAQEAKPSDLVRLMPSQSAWVISIEVARVLNEPVTMRVVEEFFRRADVEQGLEGFAQMTGLDPRKNVTRICLSGNSFGGNALETVAIEGTFDVEYLKGILSQFLPTPPVAHRTHSIYELPDERGGPPNYLAAPTQSLLLFGRETAVKAALDTLDGVANTASSLASDMAKMNSQSLVCLGVSSVDKIPGNPNPVQPHLRTLTGSIAATAEGLSLTAQVACDTAEAARDIAKIADALVAFARLQADHERRVDVKELLKLVSPATVSHEGATIKATLAVPQARLEQIYNRLIHQRGLLPRGDGAEQQPGTE